MRIRTIPKETRALLVNRMKEIAKMTAETFRGEAEGEIFTDVPPLICNKEFTTQILSYMEQIPYPNRYSVPGISSSTSDDFA